MMFKEINSTNVCMYMIQKELQYIFNIKSRTKCKYKIYNIIYIIINVNMNEINLFYRQSQYKSKDMPSR